MCSLAPFVFTRPSDNMRVLVLADKVFSRRLGDGLRVYGLLGHLAGRHEFDLICFARAGESLEPELRSLFGRVTLIPAPRTQPSPYLRRLVQSFTGAGFKITSEQMTAAVETALRGRQYDLILEVAANTLPNLPRGPLGIPLVVDSVDEPLLRELRALRNATWRERPHYLHRAWRFWQYEKRMLGRANQNLFVSEVDAGVHRRFFPGRPVTVVPNGVDIEYFAPPSTKPDPAYIVFEGNMNYGPNIDTAQRLVQEILPPLSARVGEVRIGIVGRDPSPEVLRLASDRVEVTGSVPDVRPYLARAAVFACPMRLGSGIKNKILQAWAMGRPVVATPASLGGLSARDGENILVREKPEDFAEAIAQLIRDPARAAAIGQAGRHTAESEYSWERRAGQLESILLAATGAAGHSGQGNGAGHSAKVEQVPLAPAKSG